MPTAPGCGCSGRPKAAPRRVARPLLASGSSIVYRRLTMEDVEPLDRAVAQMYATWFQALADGTRVQIVSLLARSGEPMTVGQIVAAVPVGHSTVSPPLKQISAAGV